MHKVKGRFNYIGIVWITERFTGQRGMAWHDGYLKNSTPGAMVIDQGFLGRIGISSCLSLAATTCCCIVILPIFEPLSVIAKYTQNLKY